MTGCGAKRQMEMDLRPSRGGFLRPFGCGWFIREFLMGQGPNGSPEIDPSVGAPQSDICYHYKKALLKAIAVDRATRQEERQAKREKRLISPDRIEKLAADTCFGHPTSPVAAAITPLLSTSRICRGWAGWKKVVSRALCFSGQLSPRLSS